MRVFAVTNQKGGSCKTTTSVNLCTALGEMGQRVLLIDLDPQSSASAWMGVKGVNTDKGLLAVFTDNGNLLDIIHNTKYGVDLVPSSAWLVGVEKALAGELGAEGIFHRALQQLPRRWNYVLLDCPPSLGLLTVSALAAAREVLVPVEAHVMALSGLVQLLQTVETVKERLNPALGIAGILACRVDRRARHAQEVVDRLRERFGSQVYKTVIRENIKLAEAPSFSKPIQFYDPTCRGSLDYRALAAEILATEGKA